MTGFLCALGGVCLQRKSPARATPSTSQFHHYACFSMVSSLGTVSTVSDSRKTTNVLPSTSQEQRQYCPVTQ